MKYLSIIFIFFTTQIHPGNNGQIISHTEQIRDPEINHQQQKTCLFFSETLKKIDSKKYHRYILAKSTTEDYILKMIKEFGELSANKNYKEYRFGIATKGDWKVIQLEESLSFYTYHNLVGWLTGYEEDPDTPDLSMGFAKNKTEPKEDYIFYLDPNNEMGDTQIGVFNNGDSFFIYLPEAFEEYGNLTVTSDFEVSMKENIDYISGEGIDIEDISTLKFSYHKIKMVD